MLIYQLSNNNSANTSIHNIPQKKIIDLNTWEFTGYIHVYIPYKYKTQVKVINKCLKIQRWENTKIDCFKHEIVVV